MGEDRLNCMVRDPHWIYCYWELGGDALERASKGRGPRFLETVRWVLRVRAADEAPCDVDIDSTARSWYLRVGPGRRCRVDLGLVTVGGDFHGLASGGEVETPPEPLGALGHERAAGDRGPLWRELERLVSQGLVGSSSGNGPGGPYASMSHARTNPDKAAPPTRVAQRAASQSSTGSGAPAPGAAGSSPTADER